MKKPTFLQMLMAAVFVLLAAFGTAQTTYTFSNYTAGTQYAINEKHVLDNDVTLYTTECHFTTQLRIYSSTAHDGFVVSNELPYNIDSLAFSIGNASDQLAVYGSNDSTTWTPIGTITAASAYSNKGLSFGSANYKRFKLAVVSTQQLRLQSMTVYYKAVVNPSAVATPTITPAAGFYTIPQNITINCDTAEATIRYTLDGTNPTSASTLYTTPFHLDTTATVKARAWKAGLDSSAVATAIYTFPSLTPTLNVAPATLLVSDTASATFTVTAANLSTDIITDALKY